MLKQLKQTPMSIGTAIYLAGVAFSFGIRLGQLPLPDLDGDPVSLWAFLAMAFLHLLLSIATSWLGAGVVLGGQ